MSEVTTEAGRALWEEADDSGGEVFLSMDEWTERIAAIEGADR